MDFSSWLTADQIALATQYAVRVVGALALLFFAWIVAASLRGVTIRGLQRAEFDATLTKFFANMIRYAVLILAVLSCLGLFGVDVTSFAAVLAAAGFAIGLAFQSTLSNFSAGIMLLAFRPFKVGDVVNAAGHTGVINEIELFTTRLDTPDNRRIILPNSQIFGSTIENISFHDTRRVDVDLGTDYGADLDQTRQVLESVVDGITERLPDKDTQVVLVELGDSAIAWQLRVWVNSGDYWPVKQAVMRNAKQALDQASIGIPFPQMDVNVKNS